MKKSIALALALTLALSLTACGEKKPTVELKYKNGDYSAQWASPEGGYTEYLKVNILSDVITITEFDGVSVDGAKKSADTKLAEEMQAAQSANLPYKITPQKAFGGMIENYAKAGTEKLTTQCVAGATKTSKSFFVLMNAILNGPALTGETAAAIVPLYKAGEYTVTASDFDEHGYKEFVTVAVTENGKGTIINLDAKDKDGKLRSADADTKFPVKPADLKSKLTEAFGNGDKISDIEAVAGATISTNNFKKMTAKAMNTSRLHGDTDITMSVLQDGVYRAEMSDFTNGWKDYVIAAVIDGDVQIVEYNAKNEKGSLKTDDAEFAKAIEEAPKDKLVPTLKVPDYLAKIVSCFDDASDNVLTMENVAGATVSGNNFKLMLGQLEGYSMTAGDITPLTVSADTTAPDSSSSAPVSSSAAKK